MKKTTNIKAVIVVFTIALCILHVSNVQGSKNPVFLSGKITDMHSGMVVPFANLAIYGHDHSKPLLGVSADAEGSFGLYIPSGDTLRLWISAMGYITHKQIMFPATGQKAMMLGEVMLSPHSYSLDEVMVEAERLRAVMGDGTITYLVNKNMLDAATTGTDLLSLIPGVHRNILNELVVNGSQEVLIMVNGMVRDRQYIQQIKASMIDRIELGHAPAANHDGQSVAMLHITLTEECNKGVDGHIFLESPASGTQIYAFPSYSIRYGSGKVSLFTSYNGEVSFFEIVESDLRQQPDKQFSVNDRQEVYQKYWSHRFHAGADFAINKKNHIHLYTFYNPFSQRHDGTAVTELTGAEHTTWMADKKDKDMNHLFQYSVFFKHQINEEPDNYISLDIHRHLYSGSNSITYINQLNGHINHNESQPWQQRIGSKFDYSRALSKYFLLQAGFIAQSRQLGDKTQDDFDFAEKSGGAYCTFRINNKNWTLQTGVRYELTILNQAFERINSTKALLPSFSWQYRFQQNQFIQLGYRKSIRYPAIYHLNPNVYRHSPHSIESGNPMLNPASRQNIYAEYTKRFEHHVVVARLFYSHISDAIGQLTTLDQNQQVLLTRPGNLGDISSIGLRTNASLRLTRNTNLSGSVALMHMATRPGSHGKEHQLSRQAKPAFETSLALYTNFGHDLTLSIMLQHASPELLLQGESYSGTMYMVSLDKIMGHGFKAGIVSVLPFSNTFTYQGFSSQHDALDQKREGRIQLTAVPVWFRLSYQFSSGKSRSDSHRHIEETDVSSRRGF